MHTKILTAKWFLLRCSRNNNHPKNLVAKAKGAEFIKLLHLLGDSLQSWMISLRLCIPVLFNANETFKA